MKVVMYDATEQVVVDTNVVSILLRRSDPSYPYYRERVDGRRTLISFQTLQESWFGAYNANWGGRRRKGLENHLSRFHVIWPTEELVHISAELRSKTRGIGRELNVADAWIAATALMLGCPLISHDRDFSAVQRISSLTFITYLG